MASSEAGHVTANAAMLTDIRSEQDFILFVRNRLQ
jgi:hypothetical protein